MKTLFMTFRRKLQVLVTASLAGMAAGILSFTGPSLVSAADFGQGNNSRNPPSGSPSGERRETPWDDRVRLRAPELNGGVEWFNCEGPLRLKDLRGKIVLIDFWTYCCINCMHVLPELAKLEKKYPNQLVVIGVHWAKFDAEKDSENIRKAILRYHIEHPVVNDADHAIARAYQANWWPTLALIDPEGYLIGGLAGESHLKRIDQAIANLIQIHRGKKTLKEQPLRFELENDGDRKTSPLYFPGKVCADADGKRLFIADSSHHRIVITDLTGRKMDVAGTGSEGRRDGPFEKATFNDPQGLACRGDVLYVADRKNNLIRALDLKARTVRTVAGSGLQGTDQKGGGPALTVGLNSPWDLCLAGDKLFVAMAGYNQIWWLDLKTNRISSFAGKGMENIGDGTRAGSLFAQPSGLCSDGSWLYVADSESSAIRAISLRRDGTVRTLAGQGLYQFGDEDGSGAEVRLQHCMGVACHQGKLYVADTYNNKIKILDLSAKTCRTFVGDGQSGKEDDPPRFHEPAGLSIAGNLLYVADTNNHCIRVVDLKSNEVRTLKLKGIQSPASNQKSEIRDQGSGVRKQAAR
jgi:thiol-disulfide isomerase/thioredoxin/DNA-binding beta-propeller fold protein YncE